MASDRSAQIHWRDWGDEAFEEAESQDKLILLDISAPWCHWCHVMDRTTYSHPEVIDVANDRFIPVRVDGDKRPDIQDRYLLGGWPTTAWLIPDGRILTGTTFLPPESMILKLKEVDTLYHENKALVTMQVTSMAAEAEAERTESEESMHMIYAEALESLSRIIKEDYDPTFGGFGNEPKFPYPDAIRFAFLRYRKTGDKEMLGMALKTLDAMMGIYDPVWGGFYRYSMSPDWTQPHYEKLLFAQAGAMDNFLEAYHVTADDKYGETAAGIKAYIQRFLTDNERGGFYASQDADVGSHDPDAELITGEEYFEKDESERLSVGIPYVDKNIYTDVNGMMVSAYFKLYQVMCDEHARDFALKTVDRILSENMCDGKMCHYSDGGPKVAGLLSDQVYFGQALVDAYQYSGERKYLIEADKIVEFMVSELRDVVDGGFYFRTFIPSARAEMLERHKPFDENVAAVYLLTQMSHLTGREDYRKLAERTLRGISYPQVTESIIGMGFALAVDAFLSNPLHIVLVGDKESEVTKSMLLTSLHAYDPEKLVQLLDPDDGPLTIGDSTYESAEAPIAYVCVGTVCRPPVNAPDQLAVLLEELMNE